VVLEFTLLALKVVCKGKGLPVSIASSAMIALLGYVAYQRIGPALLTASILLASLASIVVDEQLYLKTFYTLLVVGARPVEVRLFVGVVATVATLIFCLPIALIGLVDVLAYSVLAIISTYPVAFNAYWSLTKRRAVAIVL